MKSLLIHIAFLMLPLLGVSQINLVPNPGFEERDSCPIGKYELTPTCKYWYDLVSLMPVLPRAFYTYKDWGTANYFHRCNSGIVSVPDNAAGIQEPRTDDAYSGILIYSHITGGLDINKAISYIGIELQAELKRNYIYQAEFYYSLAELDNSSDPNFFIDNLYFVELGMLFTNAPIIRGLDTVTMQPHNIYMEPQVKQMMGPGIDTVNWIKVSGTFKAKGGEKHLTIGSFKEIDTMTQDAYTFIFIDDVKVVAIDSIIPEEEMKIYPIPTLNKQILLERRDSSLQGCTLYLYDMLGREAYAQRVEEAVTRTGFNLFHLRPGVYFYTLTEQNRVVKQGKLILL